MWGEMVAETTELKLLHALKRAWSQLGETCEHCLHNSEVQCNGRQCPQYIEGVGAVDSKDTTKKYPDFKWSCLDFEYGDCPYMDHTACHKCISNDCCNFELDLSTLDGK